MPNIYFSTLYILVDGKLIKPALSHSSLVNLITSKNYFFMIWA